jgi:hypothetical protein
MVGGIWPGLAQADRITEPGGFVAGRNMVELDDALVVAVLGDGAAAGKRLLDEMPVPGGAAGDVDRELAVAGADGAARTGDDGIAAFVAPQGVRCAVDGLDQVGKVGAILLAKAVALGRSAHGGDEQGNDPAKCR